MVNETPEDWLERQFEFEFCDECGGDAEDHEVCIVPGTGTYFARCLRPPRESEEPPRSGLVVASIALEIVTVPNAAAVSSTRSRDAGSERSRHARQSLPVRVTVGFHSPISTATILACNFVNSLDIGIDRRRLGDEIRASPDEIIIKCNLYVLVGDGLQGRASPTDRSDPENDRINWAVDAGADDPGDLVAALETVGLTWAAYAA